MHDSNIEIRKRGMDDKWFFFLSNYLCENSMK
jgi:hypothetical protein